MYLKIHGDEVLQLTFLKHLSYLKYFQYCGLNTLIKAPTWLKFTHFLVKSRVIKMPLEKIRKSTP